MTIFSVCHDLLLEHGPLPVDRLARAAGESGATRSKNPEAAVRSALAHKAVELPDGRWALPIRLLEGCTLTVRTPDPDDWPYEYSRASWHDIAPLQYALRSGPIPLATGGELKQPRYGGYWGPPDGWPDLAGAADRLHALRIRDGVLHVEPVDDTPQLRQRGHQLALTVGNLDERPRYYSTSAHGVSEALLTKLWALLAEGTDLLSEPVPPLGECVPPLRAALRTEREMREAEAQLWHPQLTLPADLQGVAIAAARAADAVYLDWLNAFVERSLRALPERDLEESDYGWVRPLLRGL